MTCLLSEQQHEYSHNDVDMFITTRDENEADSITRHIYDVIQSNVNKYAEERYRKVECQRTARTITIRTAWKWFQVVTTLFSSPLEVLIGFDVDCGCVGTIDGVNAVMTRRAKLALSKRYNLWILESRPSLVVEARYQRRLVKYAKKGFAVLVPNVDWTKMPILDGKRAEQVHGVAKLALFDRYATIYGGQERDVHHLFTSGIDECIHGGDSWCRSCHKKIPHSEADPEGKLSFAQPIQWDRSLAVYQDIEDGVLRRPVAAFYLPAVDFNRNAYINPNAFPSQPTSQSSSSNPESVAGDDSIDIYLDASDTASNTATHQQTYVLSSQPGIVVPKCHCGVSCALKMVKREGANHHRHFFCCRNSQTANTCRFFQWVGATQTFEEARAQRLRDRIDTNEVSELFQGLQLDTSKQLIALSSCYKSGRISAHNRNILKDTILAHTGTSSPLDPIFASYSQHLNLDSLATQLAHYCTSSVS
jgi:hypothetical protein